MWDSTAWERFWNFGIAQSCISVAFIENEQVSLGALRSNQLMVWDLGIGNLRDSADWTSDLEGFNANAFRWPVLADFCVEQNLLAIVYGGEEIILWDLERDTVHDAYCKETGARPRDEAPTIRAGAISLMFSLAPCAALLAVSDSDDDLVLLDTYEANVVAIRPMHRVLLALLTDAQSLVASFLALYSFSISRR